MENQHTKTSKILGYRELTQEEIDFMNRIKAFGPELKKLTADLATYLQRQDIAAHIDYTESARLDQADPLTWLNEGKLSLQKGLMYLTRSIAQPGFF